MIFRIAAGLACNPAPEHRWRRVTVPVAAAIFMLLLLIATSIVSMIQLEAQRTEQRSALWADTPSATDLFLAVRDDVWRGEQFPVVWMEPAGEEKPVLPPGVEQVPEPGQAIVSPALARMASRNPELARRYPNRAVLGSEGIRSGDELFAYVRIPEGRTLEEDSTADRIHAFGTTSGNGSFTPLSMQPPVPIMPVAAGVLGFLVLPGLVVLAVGLAAASEVRDKRFGVLRWLGASSRTLVALAVLETLILAFLGLVAATVFWSVLSRRLEWIPIVGHGIVRGDLMLPWWVLVVELCVGVVVTAVLAIAVTTILPAILHRHTNAGPRPASERISMTPLRTLPLVAAVIAFVLGGVVGGNLAGTLNLFGILAAIIGVPLILPSALRVVGARLGRLESVPASIAGRGLQWDPVRAARPFVGVATLLVVALAGSGFIAVARYVETTPPTNSQTQAVAVRWLDPQPSDSTRLANGLGSGLVAPTYENGNKLIVGADCYKLAQYFSKANCNPEAPFKLPAEIEPILAETSLYGGPTTEVRLASADEVTAGGSALVLDNSSLKALDGRVREAAMQTLPAPYVYSPLSFVMRESPLVPWIIGGVTVAAISLATGCLLSLVDRLLVARKNHRHLLNLGLASRRLLALEAWLFAAPYAAVVGVGLCAGVAICSLMAGISGVPVPWPTVGLLVGIAVLIGLLGVAGVTLFGARGVHENTE